MKKANKDKKVNASVLKHIKEIPRIFWYPIATIIHIIFSFIQHLYIMSLRLEKRQEFEKKHAIKIMRKAIKSVLSSNSNVVNSYNNKNVNKIFTLMLELISFITTYVGFKFFLGNVSSITPLFMAIVVQGGCYYLMNYTSSHKHSGSVKRNILLFILITVSVSTSYMGIFNGIVNPIDYIEKTYNKYQETSETVLSNYMNSQNYIEFEQSLINEKYEEYKRIIDDANIKRISIDSNNGFNTESKGFNKYGQVETPITDLVIEKSKQNQLIMQINDYTENLEEFINQYSAKNVYDACKAIIDDISLLNKDDDQNTIIYQNFMSSISDYRVLYKLIDDKNKDKSDEDIISFPDLKKYKNSSDLKTALSLTDFDELINANENGVPQSEKTKTDDSSNGQKDSNPDVTINNETLSNGFLNYIKQFSNYLLPSTEINCESVNKKIKNIIEENYNSLHELSDDENKEDLESAYQKVDLPNTQLFPFTLPYYNSSLEIIGPVVFSALVAISVDGLALMFSLALLSKRNSSLYYNNVNEFKQLREEIMEDCLMYNCLNEIEDIEQNCSIDNINFIIADNLNQMMNGFMQKVRQCYFPTSFNSYGYICDNDLKSFNSSEKNIFISLNNIAMIKPFHRDELIAVLNHDFRKADKENVISEKASEELIKKYKSLFKDDEVYYMVSKSVHVWFCDNFSELLENNIIFDQEINKI